MTHSLWQKPIIPWPTKKVQVAIIGAGITGLSVAYWLKEFFPEHSVLVFDQGGIGQGASGRNAGFVTAGSVAYLQGLVRKDGAEMAAAYWQQKTAGLALMREHLFKPFSSVPQSFHGSTTLYRDAADLNEARASVEKILPTAEVSSAELTQQGLVGFAGGLKLEQDGATDPLQLLETLGASLRKRGVEFLLNESVGWHENNILTTERGVVEAEHVFVCLNGYLGRVFPQCADWVIAKRAQILVSEAAGLKWRENFYDPSQRVYFRIHDGKLIVGGLRLLEEQRENTDFDQISPVIQEGLARYTEALLGRPAKPLARWSGTMGFTADEKPLLRAIPGQQQCYFVGGYSGHGMGMAFGHAKRAVETFLRKA